MNYKNHIGFGIFLTLILLTFNYFYKFVSFDYSLLNLIIIFVISVIYSILPDCDIRTSKIFLLIGIVFLIGIIYCFIMEEIIIGIIIAVMLLMIFLLKHRKFTHSISAGILFSIPLFAFGWVFALIGFLNYLSHLLVDKEIKLV